MRGLTGAVSGRGAGWLPAVAIGLIALAVRLGHVAEIVDSPFFDFPVVDARTYADTARELAVGGGSWLGPEAPFWQPPLYPYFLGLIWWVGGVSWLAPRLVQAVLGSLSCVLVWRLGCRALSPGIGLAAGLMAAFWGPFVQFDGELLAPTLALPLNLLALLALLRWTSVGGGPAARLLPLSCGVLLGTAALCVANVLAFVPVAAGWLYRNRSGTGDPRWVAPLLLIVGATLAVAPVTVRNWTVGGDFALISTNAGINAFVGNNPDYERTVSIQPGAEWVELVTRPRREGGVLTPSGQSLWFFARAWDFARTQPLDWLRLTAHKARLFVHGAEIGRNQDLYYARKHSVVIATLLWMLPGIVFPLGLVMPLAAVGVLLGWRARVFDRPGMRLLLWYLAVYGATVIAFFPASRYRLPVVPVVLILAGLGALSLARCVRGGWRQALLPAVVLAAFALLCNAAPPPMDADGGAQTQHRLGFAYHQKGMRANAVRHYRRALELDPGIREARYNLGAVYAEQGRFDRAIGEFLAYVERFPDIPQGYLALGDAYMRVQRYAAALEVYGKLRSDSDLSQALASGRPTAGSAQLYGRLAAAHVQIGQLEQACGAYRSLLALAPDSLEARYVLGRVLEQRELAAEARASYTRILARDPGHNRARYRLAYLLFQQERGEEAGAHLVELISREPDDLEARWLLASWHVAEHRGPEALEQAEAILAVDPDHQRATWLAGHLHTLSGDTLTGAAHIEHLRHLHVEQRQEEIAERLKQNMRDMMGSGDGP